MRLKNNFDAIVIGGGFYGASIAAWLAREKQFKVALLEQAPDLLLRASYANQARVHNGYHYPRDFVTAYRSRINLPLFVRDHRESVYDSFNKIYAIARTQSKVTAKQFERFCGNIGAELSDAPEEISRLLNPGLIEKAWVAKEFAFNAASLRESAKSELSQLGVAVHLGTRVLDVRLGEPTNVFSENNEAFTTRWLFNCTYSGLNCLGTGFGRIRTALKQEVTEMALVELPNELKDIAVTVMDGPFFSFMPFPDKNLHTLSHVRYTPHGSWPDSDGGNPYAVLDGYRKTSRARQMLLDASRYVPLLLKSQIRDSLFEVKTVLAKNEENDGRPIVFERHPNSDKTYSVLGGKIDNIYDILEKLSGVV